MKISNNPKYKLIARILILSTSIYLLLLLFHDIEYLPFTILLILTIIFQIYKMFQIMDRSNNDLNNLLNSIQHSDFSLTFQVDSSNSSYNHLKKRFNIILDSFREVRSEKEENYHFLQTVIQHIGIGVIAYNRSSGDIKFINSRLKRLLKINRAVKIYDLEKVDKQLVPLLKTIQSGDKRTIKIADENGIIELLIYSKEFKLKTESITLLSIQNIGDELNERELLSWQKLMKVLTHEIMNSITPIISLSSTSSELLEEKMIRENLDGLESYEDIKTAVNAINKRGEGLLQFVEAYRSISKVPKPNFGIIQVGKLFESISNLLRDQVVSNNCIKFTTKVNPAKVEITADEKLLEQVLINLIQNSIQSINSKISSGDRSENIIELEGNLLENGKVSIIVRDSGIGIVEEAMDKIFIPFFTTKSDGSGIGLTLSREIIRIHGGSISAKTTEESLTEFKIVL